jgi:hypothetical protein
MSGAAGVGVKTDTLLGPERTSPVFVVVVLDGRLLLGTIPMSTVVGSGCACDGVGGCLLRIVQWMRASLWSSC